MTAPTTPGPDDALREAPYVLMKRGLYWRPNGQGYTGVLAEAGRYSEQDAQARHDSVAGGTTMHLASDCGEFSPACWPETQMRVMSAELATLRTDRDRLARDLAAAREENERLKRAYGCHVQADAYRDAFPDNDADAAGLRKSETYWRLMAHAVIPSDCTLQDVCAQAATQIPEVVADVERAIKRSLNPGRSL